MSEEMSVQQLCDKLSEAFHDPLFLPTLQSKTKNSYERAFTSLDVIEDTQNAIDEFDAIPEKHIQNRTTLYIYGVMQSLYCQQDGLFHLYKTVVDPTITNGVLFKKYGLNKNVRDQRDDIAGHPADRKNGNEFYFIAKGPNSKYQFTYAGYTPDFKIVNVDIRKSIDEQKEFVLKVLCDVEKDISKQVLSHKEKFKHKTLSDYLKPIEQSYKFFADAIHSNKPVADLGISVVSEALSACKTELLDRYHNSLPASVSESYRMLEHILTKFSAWNESGILFNNIDAEMFLDSYKMHVEELKSILVEIDDDFKKEF